MISFGSQFNPQDEKHPEKTSKLSFVRVAYILDVWKPRQRDAVQTATGRFTKLEVKYPDKSDMKFMREGLSSMTLTGLILIRREEDLITLL